MTKYWQTICILVVLGTNISSGFQMPSQKRPTRFLSSTNSEEFEKLLPDTSFGAEAVPEAQRPVNEYMDVSNQPMFGWANKESGSKGLLTRLVLLYSISFAAVCYPIAGATFTKEGYLVQKLAAANVGAIFLVMIVMIRLYSGWDYLGQRLTSKVIEYEETGWYDGDIEMKTPTELQRDRFLYANEVKPVVERLKKFTMATAALCLVSVIAFNVANSAKPMFDQYDPDMLSQLRYDEKLAEQAASSSGSRPTYCDNRYYRAVAGGGQGCN
jgi:hypothetical protein